VLGQFTTQSVQQARMDDPANATAINNADAYYFSDAGGYMDDEGQVFNSWKQLYGPVSVSNYNHLQEKMRSLKWLPGQSY
jgi:hypothetical protein